MPDGINIHIYPSPFKNESRILKITETLLRAGLFERIIIAAVWESGLAERESLDSFREVIRYRRWCPRIWGRFFAKALQTLSWSWAVLCAFWNRKVRCINCHSLAVLPLGVLLKYRHGSRLIYDTHELETETCNLHGVGRIIMKAMERTLIPHADAVIAVNDSIARWYADAYRLEKVHVAKNVPCRSPNVTPHALPVKRMLGIPKDHILYIYQGAISRERGMDLLMKAFRRLDLTHHLLFMGFGEYEQAVRDEAILRPNIHFLPGVAPGLVAPYTSGADVGIHLIENTCLNHFLCLPNKIWEYLDASLPVVVSDFPEMRAVVERYGCGWTTSLVENDVVTLLERISLKDISAKKACAAASRKQFGWEQEEPGMLRAYRDIGILPLEHPGQLF